MCISFLIHVYKEQTSEQSSFHTSASTTQKQTEMSGFCFQKVENVQEETALHQKTRLIKKNDQVNLVFPNHPPPC